MPSYFDRLQSAINDLLQAAGGSLNLIAALAALNVLISHDPPDIEFECDDLANQFVALFQLFGGANPPSVDELAHAQAIIDGATSKMDMMAGL